MSVFFCYASSEGSGGWGQGMVIGEVFPCSYNHFWVDLLLEMSR